MIVSVILPLYNGIKFISEAVESVQNQTLSDWELIIVNDFGSDDGSLEVIREFMKKDSRIIIIQNNEHLGLAESLNVGIRKAKGKYIARIDADDPSMSERFEKQVEYLENHPDVFLCGTLQRSVLPDRSYDEIVPCDYEELKAALLFGCEISHCSVMFRRDKFLEEGLFYDSHSLAEDYDLWTKIMFTHKLVNISEVLVNHRWGFENISLAKGEMLKQESRKISAHTLKNNFGIVVEGEDLLLLSGWRSRPEKYAQKHRAYFIKRGYEIIYEIIQANETLKLIEENSLRKILWRRWDWICKSCGLFYTEFSYNCFIDEDVNPKVSIVLPVHNSVNTLRETVESILFQTMKEWELIVVCEKGNKDGSTELAKAFALMDKRVRVIENESDSGLSGSLNIGIQNAKSELIARIDADDLMNAKRLETQFAYMQNNPQVGITQLYQHYFGKGSDDFIHCPETNSNNLKAKLLFFCDACHSTVMFRKNVFVENNLFYREVPLEDYDLWLRAIKVTDFVTIPEIYGEYRVGCENITAQKHDEINKYMGQRIAEELKENLNVIVPEDRWILLSGWENAFLKMDEETQKIELSALESLLKEIYKANKKTDYYNDEALLLAINTKWRWAKYNESWHETKNVHSIEDVFHDSNINKKTFLWKFGKKVISGMQKYSLHTHGKIIEHQSRVTKDVAEAQSNRLEKNIDKKVEGWTWDRYLRLENKLNENEDINRRIKDLLTEESFNRNKVKYSNGEKIRIVFLFQIASFWPSWESFYEACINDSKLDIKFLFLDETRTEKSQMNTARTFLEESGLPYIDYNEFDLDAYKPHVIVMQTPYDKWHRQDNHFADVYKSKGYRVVYVPYGVEISDTEDSHKLHFDENVIRNAWRIYTFSEVMKRDYNRYCLNSGAVRAFGLPRFDLYALSEKKKLSSQIESQRRNRPIVLWKVHFPKEIIENGKKKTVTPRLEEYVDFSNRIADFDDFFFIFMPHPKFLDMAKTGNEEKMVRQIWDNVETSENAYIDDKDDYSISLMNSDYIIVDRSAVMVEAGALGVPVLYMENQDYQEPVTKAIKPLIDSYYIGHSCDDMELFLDNCRKGFDPRKIAREKAFVECLPYFDGKAGIRVKEDIINGVINDEK